MAWEVVSVSYGTLIIVIAAVWLSVGLTLSLVMGRRGHDAFGWLILGTLFGPLSAIFAVEARGAEQMRPEVVAPERSHGSGPVDVLAGVDGSPESRAAIEAAIALLGARLGRLTLATVIPYDTGVATERQVEAHLASHLDRLPPQDAKSRAIVEQMRVDEIAHGKAAEDMGAEKTPLPIQLAMKAMSKVMTSTTYYI